MQHILDDQEYQSYIELQEKYNELNNTLEHINENAVYYMDKCETFGHKIYDGLFKYESELKCAAKPSKGRGEYYCDECPVGWILPKCPLGYNKEYSK
jgi:hypothetical protein